jgi:hypothetical protein
VKISAPINLCDLFYDAITIRHDVAVNGRMTDLSGIRKNLFGSLMKEISYYFPLGTLENHNKPQDR